MVTKKKLYESTQVLEAQVAALTKQLEGTLYSSSGNYANNINPAIVNSAEYNMVLSVADEIQAASRYITDIPELNLPSNRLEAMFYRYGSLCFFTLGGELKVSSYAKSGKLNGLGDLTRVRPIDFGGNSYNEKFTVVYDNKLIIDPCVIINDYTGTYREDKIVPRAAINSVSIRDQATVYRQLKNSIKLTAKKAIALLDSETQREAIERVVIDLLDNDSPVMGITGKSITDVFKVYNIDTKLDIEGYLRAIESYERMRANFNGIKTRSSVEKKERLITSEAENDNTLTDIYLYDGLLQRQIGIELMKKHAIIKEGSCIINPILIPKKEEKEKDDDRNKNSK
jgi:hypothetical protein